LAERGNVRVVSNYDPEARLSGERLKEARRWLTGLTCAFCSWRELLALAKQNPGRTIVTGPQAVDLLRLGGTPVAGPAFAG